MIKASRFPSSAFGGNRLRSTALMQFLWHGFATPSETDREASRFPRKLHFGSHYVRA